LFTDSDSGSLFVLDTGHSRIVVLKKTGEYDYDGQMTYVQAIEFARNVMIKKSFAKQDAPKKVIVLDIQEKTAAGKVYAWWGIDYVLLSKDNDKWMIEQVLWEGPPAKENK
jgi:hypothetical protein